MVDIKQVLGKNIRRKRKEMNISQEKLAELCGLHRTYVGAIERGERNVSLENMHRIAKALNLPISELLKEE